MRVVSLLVELGWRSIDTGEGNGMWGGLKAYLNVFKR